jgi:TusA-related sulfurtransferase
LALEKLSKNEQLIVELDKGEPEEMVLNNLKEMGCFFKQIKENEKFIKIKILNEN